MRYEAMRLLAFLFLLLPSIAQAATSPPHATPRDTVTLISASNTARNGAIRLALKFQLAPHWHIYWQNPGDAGLAPQITLGPPASAGPFSDPPPELLIQGPITDYVLSGNPILAFTATQTGPIITATAQWLVCSDICVPEHASFTLSLLGGPAPEAALFATPKIVPSPFPSHIAPDGTLTLAGPTAAQVASAHFFPDTPGIIIDRAPQPLAYTGGGIALKISTTQNFRATQPLAGILELTDKSGAMQALSIHATPGPALGPSTPLIAWIGLAFLGGLVLNLMPCVFPILAMKALALIRLGGAERAKIRREAFGYTAGVLAAMLILAVSFLVFREFGIAVGWGFQFQSPIFVALIAWLIFCSALSLAGVFEISVLGEFAGRLATRNSFVTGLLAVIVATPCTAPFMGGAIAAALTAPAAAALGIFLALGLGLAAPFLLIAIIPTIAGFLPRPGSWMLFLQRAVSIPMFLTFIWLAWVFSYEAGARGVLLLLIGAAALTLAVTNRRRRWAAVVSLLILPVLHTTAATAALTLPNAEPFSAARLAQLRAAHQPVFIDLTAAWCITCLVNDHTTLATAAVQSAFAAEHVTILVGDWTNHDDAITALLQSNHRAGVPLYFYIPATGDPTILPQILTPAIVLSSIH